MGKAAIVDEFVADGATGPAATKHRFVPIQTLLADFAVPGLNPQQHWLPVPPGFSDAHGEGSIAKRSAEKQARIMGGCLRP